MGRWGHGDHGRQGLDPRDVSGVAGRRSRGAVGGAYVRRALCGVWARASFPGRRLAPRLRMADRPPWTVPAFPRRWPNWISRAACVPGGYMREVGCVRGGGFVRYGIRRSSRQCAPAPRGLRSEGQLMVWRSWALSPGRDRLVVASEIRVSPFARPTVGR